jgi:hypothetical protein
MSTEGVTPDEPKVANLKDPSVNPVEIMTSAGKMLVDMRKVKEIADARGIDKHDVFSIPGYRNARGELVPMYDEIRFEYHKPPKGEGNG